MSLLDLFKAEGSGIKRRELVYLGGDGEDDLSETELVNEYRIVANENPHADAGWDMDCRASAGWEEPAIWELFSGVVVISTDRDAIGQSLGILEEDIPSSLRDTARQENEARLLDGTARYRYACAMATEYRVEVRKVGAWSEEGHSLEKG